MNVAILGESEADEGALRILAEGLWGKPFSLVEKPRLQSRGWPAVRQVVGAIIRHLHYQTDAEGLIFIVDSNHSAIHEVDEKHLTDQNSDCRLCQLRRVVERAKINLKEVRGKKPLKTAIGLAVPSIEAWLQCGVNSKITEAAWWNGLRSGVEPYSKLQLKQNVYGTDRPSLPVGKKKMLEEATRLVGRISYLESLFPIGFGAFANDLRNWPKSSDEAD